MFFILVLELMAAPVLCGTGVTIDVEPGRQVIAGCREKYGIKPGQMKRGRPRKAAD